MSRKEVIDEELIDAFDGESISYPQVSTTATAYPPMAVAASAVAAAAAPLPTINSMETTRRWKNVLVESGMSVEFAWKFGLVLARNGFDERNAHLLTYQDLVRLGIGANAKEQVALLNTIARLVAEHNAEEEQQQATGTITQSDQAQVLARWRNLFRRAKLDWPSALTLQYATLLSSKGWDESNAEQLSDEELRDSVGISNAAHRLIILELIDRERAEAEYNPEFNVNAVLEQESKVLQRELKQKIEAFDEFQTRLAQILRGDTDKQRESRARREVAREARRLARQQQQQRRNSKE